MAPRANSGNSPCMLAFKAEQWMNLVSCKMVKRDRDRAGRYLWSLSLSARPVYGERGSERELIAPELFGLCGDFPGPPDRPGGALDYRRSAV